MNLRPTSSKRPWRSWPWRKRTFTVLESPGAKAAMSRRDIRSLGCWNISTLLATVGRRVAEEYGHELLHASNHNRRKGINMAIVEGRLAAWVPVSFNSILRPPYGIAGRVTRCCQSGHQAQSRDEEKALEWGSRMRENKGGET